MTLAMKKIGGENKRSIHRLMRNDCGRRLATGRAERVLPTARYHKHLRLRNSDFGHGYQFCFGKDGGTLIILLGGGKIR